MYFICVHFYMQHERSIISIHVIITVDSLV